MKQKEFIKTAKIIFGVVALAHLLRAVMGWPLQINDIMIPVWISYIAAVVSGYLAYSGYKLLK